jgi:hypothetical protein
LWWSRAWPLKVVLSRRFHETFQPRCGRIQQHLATMHVV